MRPSRTRFNREHFSAHSLQELCALLESFSLTVGKCFARPASKSKPRKIGHSITLSLIEREKVRGVLMAILASILWRRIDTPGHDTCRLESNENGWTLLGTSIFHHQFGPASLSYSLKCDLQWKTVWGRVWGIAGDQHIDYLVSHEGECWTLNGNAVSGLESLVDLDFSFTPATNLAQIRRVPIPINKPVQLPVVWLDIDTGTLTKLLQAYERRAEMQVWYEAPSVGYRGMLELAPSGFIRRYPNLWEAENTD